MPVYLHLAPAGLKTHKLRPALNNHLDKPPIEDNAVGFSDSRRQKSGEIIFKHPPKCNLYQEE